MPAVFIIPPELDALAGRQYGLLATRQLRGAVNKEVQRGLVRRGMLVPVGPGVYRCAGAATSWRQRVMAACLGYGDPVAASHTAAARLWGLEQVAARVEVSVPAVRSGRRPDVITHRTELDPTDVGERHGIPTTSASRTMIDLAGRVGSGVMEDCLDHLLREGLLDLSELAGRLEATSPFWPAPLAGLRRLVAERMEHGGSGDSGWADRVYWWLVRAGLGEPVRQHQVVFGDSVYVLDLAYPEERVAVEFDGFRWHSGRRSFDRDRARLTELALGGWLVVLVTSAQGQEVVVERTRRALLSRAA